jgi:hypothetical protein
MSFIRRLLGKDVSTEQSTGTGEQPEGTVLGLVPGDPEPTEAATGDDVLLGGAATPDTQAGHGDQIELTSFSLGSRPASAPDSPEAALGTDVAAGPSAGPATDIGTNEKWMRGDSGSRNADASPETGPADVSGEAPAAEPYDWPGGYAQRFDGIAPDAGESEAQADGQPDVIIASGGGGSAEPTTGNEATTIHGQHDMSVAIDHAGPGAPVPEGAEATTPAEATAPAEGPSGPDGHADDLGTASAAAAQPLDVFGQVVVGPVDSGASGSADQFAIQDLEDEESPRKLLGKDDPTEQSTGAGEQPEPTLMGLIPGEVEPTEASTPSSASGSGVLQSQDGHEEWIELTSISLPIPPPSAPDITPEGALGTDVAAGPSGGPATPIGTWITDATPETAPADAIGEAPTPQAHDLPAGEFNTLRFSSVKPGSDSDAPADGHADVVVATGSGESAPPLGRNETITIHGHPTEDAPDTPSDVAAADPGEATLYELEPTFVKSWSTSGDMPEEPALLADQESPLLPPDDGPVETPPQEVDVPDDLHEVDVPVVAGAPTLDPGPYHPVSVELKPGVDQEAPAGPAELAAAEPGVEGTPPDVPSWQYHILPDMDQSSAVGRAGSDQLQDLAGGDEDDEPVVLADLSSEGIRPLSEAAPTTDALADIPESDEQPDVADV